MVRMVSNKEEDSMAEINTLDETDFWVSWNDEDTCTRCKGSGWADEYAEEYCADCWGEGYYRV